MVDADLDRIAALLREAGVPFAFLHGSRASGTSEATSDIDIAVWLTEHDDELALRSHLPDEVDLLVLNHAPLELAGRVALHGRLLVDDDAAQRVHWQASTRKIFLDEQYRVEQARRDFADAHRG